MYMKMAITEELNVPTNGTVELTNMSHEMLKKPAKCDNKCDNKCENKWDGNVS